MDSILGREPVYGATRPAQTFDWCEENVESVLESDGDNTRSSPDVNILPYTKGAQIHILCSALTREECQNIIQSAEDYNSYSTGRHHLYPTTDVVAQDLSTGDASLALAQGVLLPCLAHIFDTPVEHLNFKDMFVAKYSPSGQPGLGEHTDGSAYSFNLLLSDTADFEGGGTSFEQFGRVQPTQGSVLLHRGSLLHQGNPVTEGVRYVLVGFVQSDAHFIPSHERQSRGSEFFQPTITSFPLGIVLEVDEGDGDRSAVMVVSCEPEQGSAYAAGLRIGDCIRGAIIRHGNNDDDNAYQEEELELWDGTALDRVLGRLAVLQQRKVPLDLVVERTRAAE